MPLIIECQEHFDNVSQFARDAGCHDALQRGLDRLTAMTSDDEKCYLHTDFAPLSFAFLIMRKDGRRGLVGGLIYSGPGQRLDGQAPTYTVSVEPHTDEHRWSVHT